MHEPNYNFTQGCTQGRVRGQNAPWRVKRVKIKQFLGEKSTPSVFTFLLSRTLIIINILLSKKITCTFWKIYVKAPPKLNLAYGPDFTESDGSKRSTWLSIFTIFISSAGNRVDCSALWTDAIPNFIFILYYAMQYAGFTSENLLSHLPQPNISKVIRRGIPALKRTILTAALESSRLQQCARIRRRHFV